MASAVPKIPE